MTAQSLRDKARREASQSWGDSSADAEAIRAEVVAEPPQTEEAAVPLVPLVDLAEPTTDDPEKVSVFVAWARVMRDVHGVAKRGEYNAMGTRYNFRGVDAMINAFGPACRRHGIVIVPHRVEPSHAPAMSANNKAMRETTTVVTWRVYGPSGDHFEGQSEGESLDTGDKGTAKAQSIALRVFLISAGLVPTDEKDPDSQHIERGERPMPKAADYVEEICDPKTTLRRLLTIKGEVERFNLGPHEVMNPNGDREPLGRLLWRIGAEREKEQKKLDAVVDGGA